MTEPENQPHTPTPDEGDAAVSPAAVTETASSEPGVTTPVVSETPVETQEAVPTVEMVSQGDAAEAHESASKTKWYYYVGAVVLVAIITGGVLFLMDRQGRIDLPLFAGIDNFIAKQTAVATVNGTNISEYDYNVSVAQITAGAQAQGADLSDPELQSQINSQAMDMLVNTELLKQEAARRGISVTDEDVQNRLSSLETEVGGPEVLKERMTQFNIDDKTLRRDIYNELTIQQLLDQVFEETAITVTDEEIESLYAGAAAGGGELPPLEEVRDQVIAQIRGGKEQEVVTTFLQTLRETAAIEILI